MLSQKKRLLDQVRDRLRLKNYAYRTEKSYLYWINQFILLHNKRHPNKKRTARFVEVERDVEKNLEQSQAKWRNLLQASGGRMFVVCDNRACIRNIRSEINYTIVNKPLVVSLTNLADIQVGKRGEGDRIWLEVKHKSMD